MSEWKSEQYRAALSEDGLLSVYNGKHTLRKTMSDGAGGIRVEITDADHCRPEDRKMLEWMDRQPVFSACWGGGTDWWVDLDAGMARWNGCKQRRQLREALLNCGFGPKEVSEILRQAKKRCDKPWNSCPRRY